MEPQHRDVFLLVTTKINVHDLRWLTTVFINYNSPTSNSFKKCSKMFLLSLLTVCLRTFARKFSNIDFFLRILPLKGDELVMPEM